MCSKIDLKIIAIFCPPSQKPLNKLTSQYPLSSQPPEIHSSILSLELFENYLVQFLEPRTSTKLPPKWPLKKTSKLLQFFVHPFRNHVTNLPTKIHLNLHLQKSTAPVTPIPKKHSLFQQQMFVMHSEKAQKKFTIQKN